MPFAPLRSKLASLPRFSRNRCRRAGLPPPRFALRRASPKRSEGGEACTTICPMVRVELPQHLRTLAHVGVEISLDVRGQVTQRSVIDAIEARYPMLRGTIRDYATDRRRPFLRFYACEEDLSHELPDAPLPDAVASGKEPYLIVGALAGG